MTAHSDRWARWLLAGAISLFLLALYPAVMLFANTRVGVDAVSEGLTCQCGCGLTVANCNHPNCEFSVPVREQIEAMLAKGKTRGEIIGVFRAKYGEKVLSAPTTEGFNLMAWIMPFAALFAGGGLILALFGRWRRTAPPADDAPIVVDDPFDSELRARLDAEIKEKT